MASSQHREIQISQATIHVSPNLSSFLQIASCSSLSCLFIQYCFLLHLHSLVIPLYSTWECYLKSLLSLRIIPDKSNMGCYPTLTVINTGVKVSVFCSPSSLFYEVQYLLHTIYMLAPFFTIPSGTWLPFHFSGYSLLFNLLGHWTFHSTVYFYAPYSQPWLPIFSWH